MSSKSEMEGTPEAMQPTPLSDQIRSQKMDPSGSGAEPTAQLTAFNPSPQA